jgi:hypothetical protein
MWTPSKPVICGVGAIFTAHYLVTCFDDPRKPSDVTLPPLASVVMASSTSSLSTWTIVNSISDDEHRVTGLVVEVFHSLDGRGTDNKAG